MDKKQIRERMESLLSLAEKEKRDFNDQESVEWSGLEIALKAAELSEGKTKRSIPIPAPQRGDATVEGVRTFGGVGIGYRGCFYPDGKTPDTRDAEKHFIELVEKRTMMAGVATQGGSFVPESHTLWTMDGVLSRAVAYPLCYHFPALDTGSGLSVGAMNSYDQSAGYFGSVASQWKPENGNFDVKTPRTENIDFTLFKNGLFINCTREAIEDSGTIGGTLGPLMTMALAQTLDQAILHGTGIGMPLGVVEAPATIVVSRVGANTVTWPDLVSMYARLHPAAVRNAVWIVSNEVIPQLLQMTGDDDSFIWMPSMVDSAKSAMPGRLLGLPLFISDKASQLGAKGDVILADFSFYGFVQKRGIIVEMSNSPLWTQDVLSFRAITRCDGKPLLSQTITPQNGGDSLSPFVVLQ